MNSLWIRLAALSVGLIIDSSAKAELRLIDSSDVQSRGQVIGSVKTVLDGESTGAAFRRVPEGAFLYALGAASVGSDPAGQGETLVVGNRAFVKTLDAGCGFCTRSGAPGENGKSPWAAFLAGVGADAKPVARYRLEETSGGMAAEDLYRELAAKHGPLIGVAGVGQFEVLEASAVRKAPAFGDPLLGPKKAEYFHPKAVMHDKSALFFGLVLRSIEDSTPGTQAVFYVNPDDKSSTGTQSHTHFGVVTDAEGIDPARPVTSEGRVQEVAHLLTQSRLRDGEVVVYRVADLQQVAK